MAEVPVIWVDVDDERARRILVADNRTTRLGHDDPEALASLLTELAETEGGLDGTGFDGDDLDALLVDLNGERPDPWRDRDHKSTKPENPVTKLGDRWQLGEHFLICGDATLDDAYVDLPGQPSLIVTDPPYGVGYGGGGGVSRDAIENDELSGPALGLFLESVFRRATAASSPGSAVYVCCPAGDSLRWFVDTLHDLEVYRWSLAWVKDRGTFGRADYHHQHELILYGWTPRGAHHKVEDRTQTTVWQFDRPTSSDLHPTEKPVELYERAIGNSSERGDTVLDPFAGSGTVFAACHNTGRTAIGIEIDPGYCDVICERYQRHTGTKPILEATGEPHDFVASD